MGIRGGKGLSKFEIKPKLTVNDVLFDYKGHSQHFTMIRFINHLILVAKMCVGIFKYSTPLEIKFLFDRELSVKRKSRKIIMDRRQRCKNRTVPFYTHNKEEKKVHL